MLSVQPGDQHCSPYGDYSPILTLEFDLEPPCIYRPYHCPVDESRRRHWIQIESIIVFHIPDKFISCLLNIIEPLPRFICSF